MDTESCYLATDYVDKESCYIATDYVDKWILHIKLLKAIVSDRTSAESELKHNLIKALSLLY